MKIILWGNQFTSCTNTTQLHLPGALLELDRLALAVLESVAHLPPSKDFAGEPTRLRKTEENSKLVFVCSTSPLGTRRLISQSSLSVLLGSELGPGFSHRPRATWALRGSRRVRSRCESAKTPYTSCKKSQQHPKDFPGGPPPQY